MSREIILLGSPESKRTLFLEQAARQIGVSLTVMALPEPDKLADFPFDRLKNSVIKVDPVEYQTAEIAKLNELAKAYIEFLKVLKKEPSIEFLNDLTAVEQTIRKSICKQQLTLSDVPTTPVLKGTFEDVEQLRATMIRRRVYNVFIKPEYGAGAAGVAAYRYHLKSGRQQLYTSVICRENQLYNTKRLTCYREKTEIEQILNLLLQQEVIVERWMPKAMFGGLSYDLRVVWQFDQSDFIVARRAQGPITNLHLNNRAMSFEQLNLPSATVEKIKIICRRTVSCFPGLTSAGMDVLLTPEQSEPYIIEVNGQGDLIYQDIYHENRIYRQQINYLKEKAGL